MWPLALSSHYFCGDFDAIYCTSLHYVRVVVGYLCVISNKVVMNCGMQPFCMRWSESKYSAVCSDALFLPMSFPKSLIFCFSHCFSYTAHWKRSVP